MDRFGLVIALFTIALIFEACATTQNDWERASQQDRIEAYETFMNIHPGTEYANLARDRIEQIKFENAKETGDPKSMEVFRSVYPHGKYSAEAKNLTEEFAFEKAKETNSEVVYEEFLKKYPSGKYSAEAKNLGAQLAFERVTKLNTDLFYESFLHNFPDSDLAPEAALRLRKIRYGAARKAKSVARYEEFIKQYPQGQDTMDLEKELPMIRKWEKAKQLGETALKMAPVAHVGFVAAPLSGQMSGGGLTIEQSPTLKQDLVEFRELLKAGADPRLVRISGFEPAGGTSFGNPGEVVPAEEGGITLLEFLKANRLTEAYDLLKKF